MAKKHGNLRVVAKGEKPTVAAPVELRFIQISSVLTADGLCQLFAVSTTGVVYGYTGNGWLKLYHEEVFKPDATDTPTTV